MTEKYRVVYELLELPEQADKLLTGEIEPPSLIYKSPFECYGFPPALLPFWSDGSSPSYVGFWKHWFNDREISIVNYYVEEGRAYQRARTLEQFAWTELLRIDDTQELKENAVKFAKEFDIEDLSILDPITSETGDLPEGLLKLKAFKQKAPLDCFPNQAEYDGDFPTEEMELSEENLRNICSLEIGEELKQKISASENAPDRLTVEVQKGVFSLLLKANDFNGAWMSLNSSGWNYGDAKRALAELANAVNDPAFSKLAEAWIDEPHESAGGY